MTTCIKSINIYPILIITNKRRFIKKIRDTKDSSKVLLIDNNGLSHYTTYLAYGLSRFKEIILYGFSYEDYVLTGAINERNIKFCDVGKKFPKHNLLLLRIPSQLIFFLRILLVSLFTTNYDIVHIQGHLPLFFLFIPMLKLRSKYVCWTLHDVKPRPSTNSIFGKIELFYLKAVTQPRLLAKYVDSIIVHGQVLKAELTYTGVDKNKIHILPHFDYQYLLNLVNVKLKKQTLFEDYILIFGRIVPYKGFNILIEAIRIARNLTNNKFNVLISGKGDISYLEGLLNTDDYEYITICHNFVPYSRIPDLFERAKFLVLPYTNASQSGVIPLAYTFSKPVIVSNVGSLPEYVDQGETGYIFELNNSTQLATYIVDLIENEQKCKEMGEKAKLKLLAEMSLEKCCVAVNNIYQKK